MDDLRDKTILLTGASTGIGAAAARLFVAEGAKVALVDRDAEALAGIAAALGDRVHGIAVDVSDSAAMKAAVEGAVAPDDLGAFAGDIRDKLAALDKGEGDIADLRKALSVARAAYDTAAGALSDARAEAATRLDAAMSEELAPLKMERAVFTTEISETDPGPDGRDAVTFTVATNPGAPSGPLNKIASGGELSRFLLALKVCLTKEAEGLTMIFDEIDRGVGGATADAVGRRLKRLADEGGQVLVVTHSPQVAALGAHHWRVAKAVEDDVTLSRVTPLDAGDRVDEIARMISGDVITEEARAAAKSLLG